MPEILFRPLPLPGDFLPAFEHFRMMGELDRWVVRNALRRLGQGFGVRKPEPIDDLFKS